MAIQWSKALSTGLDWQDEQHKQLIRHVDDLLEAMHRHEGPAQVAKLLEFLAEYTDYHFLSEEGWMHAYGDPEYAVHKREHERLRSELAAYISSLKRAGPSTVLVMQVQNWMRDWILNHICLEDHKMGEFAVKNQIKAEPPQVKECE